jgi:glycerate-2-kinase
MYKMQSRNNHLIKKRKNHISKITNEDLNHAITNNKHILFSLGKQAWNMYKAHQAYYFKNQTNKA